MQTPARLDGSVSGPAFIRGESGVDKETAVQIGVDLPVPVFLGNPQDGLRVWTAWRGALDKN